MFVIVVSPVILRLQGIDYSLSLKDAIFVDILNFQSRHSFPFFGEFRWTAAFNGLSQYFSSSILPSMATFSIDIVDLKSISNEIPAIIGHDFRSSRKDVLGTERVNVSFGTELNSLGSCSFYIINVKRIGSLIDMLTAIRHRLNKSRKSKVGRSGTLRYEHLRRSPSNIMLQEG